MPNLKLEHLHKYYDGVHAVNDVCLDISGKHFVVLAGPSGCGKSTLLKMIAGFLTLSEGMVTIDQKRIDILPSAQREIAMVFQEDALFPHLTVYENIAFGLAYGGMDQREISQHVYEMAKILSISELLERKAAALSNGQKQRVSIARALVRNPKLFLMDEPLSALDARLKTQLRIEISEIFKRMDATFLYVTHDQMEAMTLADILIIMKDGVFQQVGNPMEIYRKPVNLFTASFLGKFEINQFVGHIQEHTLYWKNNRLPLTKAYENKKIIIAVRVEHIIIDEEYGNKGTIVLIENMGDECYFHIKWENQIIIMKGNTNQNITPNKSIMFSFRWKNALFFDKENEQRMELE